MTTAALKQKLDATATLADFEALYPPRQIPTGAEVVRVAPSPTGLPHIGTAMQCVIDRALADKVKGGIFMLRIEDTDRARTVPGAVEEIIAALKWLGTVPNEGVEFGGDYGPYLQSDRLQLYQTAANYLVENGHAYHCFCTAERLDALREAQAKAKMMPKYDNKCRAVSNEEAQKRIAAGEKSVIRMKIPAMKEKIKFTDLVRGEIEFDAKMLDDNVLLKSDGYPTYHLAAVVDDHFMRVTTIVRGEEWISSTPKHVLLYRAFGWEAPRFLHTVLLRDEQRRKLSKRSGDTSISWFRAQGYLPEGFRNFLTRVMWAHPENKDIYGLDEFTKMMSPDHLPSTGPVVDMKLLGFINGKYLATKAPAELRQCFVDYIDYLLAAGRLPELPQGVAETQRPTPTLLQALRAEIVADTAHADKVMSLEPERHQKLADILYQCGYFFNSTYYLATQELLDKICDDKSLTAKILHGVAKACTQLDNAETFDKELRAVALAHGVKDKIVFMLTRASTTGQERTPPLHEVLHMLGQDVIQKRIAETIALVS